MAISVKGFSMNSNGSIEEETRKAIYGNEVTDKLGVDCYLSVDLLLEPSLTVADVPECPIFGKFTVL